MKLLNILIQRPTIVVVLFAVSTIYPGASPEEVESSVSKKIEDAVSSLESIDEMTTTSMEGFSFIIVKFKDGTDANVAAQNAQRKVTAIRNDLPAGVQEPSVDVFDINDQAIMTLAVTAEHRSETELYDIVKNDIAPLLEQIHGVARISLTGGREREIQVDIDGQRLATYGMSIPEVYSLLNYSNTDFPAGRITDGEKQVSIRLSGKFKTTGDIENTILKTLPDGSIVKVSDVAHVYDGQKDVESITRYNGAEAIGLSIQKQLDANAVKVSEEVRQVVARAEEKYKADGLAFRVAYNSSDFTLAATDSVVEDLLLAIVFVALAMLLCLHSVRNALIVMIAIPVSLISTLAIMYAAGASLNLMTLMALSLVIGILVDDSIVVIENIHRHLEMGKTRMQATFDGVREIGGSIITLTLVLVVVFLPMAFLGGMMGSFFGQFSLVIATAALVSLLVSLTIIPSLTVRFGKLEILRPDTFVGKVFKWFEELLKRQPLVTGLFTTVGVEENGSVEANRAEINVKMVGYDQRNVTDREYARQIKLFLQQHIVEAEITTVPVSMFGGADDAPIGLPPSRKAKAPRASNATTAQAPSPSAAWL